MMIEDPERLKAMRAAFAARDRSKDGDFVVAVRSTRIYCRPSCPARRPRAENIAFYSDSVSAEAAGFRPCKRCRPDEAAREVQAVLAGIAALRDAGQALALAELSSLTGYSSGHFQRVFKRATGLSPAAYGRALRAERAQEVLSDGKRVSDAIYDAGFAASSRFYEAMEGRLGMVPSAWLNGGAGSRIFWSVVDTSLGAMLVAATDRGVCRLAFGEGLDDLARRFPNADLVEGGETFSSLLERVVASVERPGTEMDIPLDVRGTAFQEQVWEALKAIPAGETRTYAQIAAAVGSPKAVRAAGSANGANPVAVLVPCHRVIRSDGSLGGYAYGNEIKQELLRREQNK